MKTEKQVPHQFNSISEFHRMLGLPKPLHPLISLIDDAPITPDSSQFPQAFTFNFYKISYKKGLDGKMRYGQNYYDFDEAGLVFMSPKQLLGVPDHDKKHLDCMLLFHPDFIRNYPLAKRITNYGFFSYSANEVLYLSEKETNVILGILKNIQDELQTNIDDFSQDIVVAQIELLLNYSNRFYKRQFITRKAVSTDILASLEKLLSDYFENDTALTNGLPSVQYLADSLNFSPHYLSDMLRSLTGQNAQQHIHGRLIEKAKEMLSTTNLSIAEVAYTLGFEHPQSFNKLFKRKTQLSPSEFRQSFN
jgi:AraC family transcriptional activator of pobA